MTFDPKLPSDLRQVLGYIADGATTEEGSKLHGRHRELHALRRRGFVVQHNTRWTLTRAGAQRLPEPTQPFSVYDTLTDKHTEQIVKAVNQAMGEVIYDREEGLFTTEFLARVVEKIGKDRETDDG